MSGASPIAKKIGRGAAIAAGVYGLVVLAGAAFARSMLFPAPWAERPSAPPGAEVRDVRAADGVALLTVAFPAPEGARTLVYFHGNGDTVHGLVPLGEELHRRGLGVVLAEYRGYGGTKGSPTEDALYADAAAVLDDLAARGVSRERVVLVGQSLGTGVAAEMAARGRASALVLITPFTSIPDVAAKYAPFLPVHTLVRDKFDTLAKVKSIRVPALVVHGDRDEVVPYAMGRDLALALPDARLLTIPGGRHNDLFALEGERLVAAIATFAHGEATAMF